MALDTILEKLHEERDRLTKELNRVVKMIRAAGKGVQAAVQEYGRRTKAKGRKRAPAKNEVVCGHNCKDEKGPAREAGQGNVNRKGDALSQEEGATETPGQKGEGCGRGTACELVPRTPYWDRRRLRRQAAQ